MQSAHGTLTTAEAAVQSRCSTHCFKGWGEYTKNGTQAWGAGLATLHMSYTYQAAYYPCRVGKHTHQYHLANKLFGLKTVFAQHHVG